MYALKGGETSVKKQSNSIHTERLTIRISKSLLQEVKKKAKANEMKVSEYVRMILKRSL